MTLSKKRQRDLIRVFHLVLAVPIGVLVHAPPALVVPVRLALQGVVFPALLLTGLWLWLGTKLIARLRRPLPGTLS